MRGWVTGALAAAALAVTGIVLPVDAQSRAGTFVLLADGRFAQADLETGTLRDLGRVPNVTARPQGRGPYLLHSGRLLLAIFPGASRRLYRFDLESGRLLPSLSLGRGVIPRALLIGPRTHRLYVVANTVAEGGGGAVRALVYSPDARRRLRSRLVRGVGDVVFNAAISSDETHIAVSYHGVSEGFDLVDARSLRLSCRARGQHGCFDGHGAVVYAGTRLFTSTGRQYLDELTRGRRLVRRDSRLAGNHLLEPAATSKAVFVVGNCDYAGGVARLDLATGRMHTLVRTRGEACGTTIAAAGDALLVAANPNAAVTAENPARLVVIDPASGAERSVIPTSAGILDLAAP